MALSFVLGSSMACAADSAEQKLQNRRLAGIPIKPSDTDSQITESTRRITYSWFAKSS